MTSTAPPVLQLSACLPVCGKNTQTYALALLRSLLGWPGAADDLFRLHVLTPLQLSAWGRWGGAGGGGGPTSGWSWSFAYTCRPDMPVPGHRLHSGARGMPWLLLMSQQGTTRAGGGARGSTLTQGTRTTKEWGGTLHYAIYIYACEFGPVPVWQAATLTAAPREASKGFVCPLLPPAAARLPRSHVAALQGKGRGAARCAQGRWSAERATLLHH